MMKSLMGKTRRADVRFYPNGRIDVTKRLCLALNLDGGDVLDILEDERGARWLTVRFRAAQGKHHCQLHRLSDGALRAWCKSLCVDMGASERSVGMAAGDVCEIGGELAAELITKLKVD